MVRLGGGAETPTEIDLAVPYPEGDPLAGISVVLNNVRWVMKSGEAVMDKTKATSVR